MSLPNDDDDLNGTSSSSSYTFLISLITQDGSEGVVGGAASSFLSSRLLDNPWLNATVCSGMVGLSGLFPLLLLSLGKTSKTTLRFMLSFACGGLLGDVFLHLLPEAYANARSDHLSIGLWIILGLLTFTIVEMMCHAGGCESGDKDDNANTIKVSGYLNLVANCIDNFAHGLAVGGAFLVDSKTGFITTSCILCHEIPHEIGDFAILMNSGFSRYDAARAQFCTALLGITGALLALFLDSFVALDSFTAWIIPFTSGGFLHISLVTVLPDLMKSDTVGDAVRVLSGIGLGISAMVAVSSL